MAMQSRLVTWLGAPAVVVEHLRRVARTHNENKLQADMAVKQKLATLLSKQPWLLPFVLEMVQFEGELMPLGSMYLLCLLQWLHEGGQLQGLADMPFLPGEAGAPPSKHATTAPSRRQEDEEEADADDANAPAQEEEEDDDEEDDDEFQQQQQQPQPAATSSSSSQSTSQRGGSGQGLQESKKYVWLEVFDAMFRLEFGAFFPDIANRGRCLSQCASNMQSDLTNFYPAETRRRLVNALLAYFPGEIDTKAQANAVVESMYGLAKQRTPLAKRARLFFGFTPSETFNPLKHNNNMGKFFFKYVLLFKRLALFNDRLPPSNKFKIKVEDAFIISMYEYEERSILLTPSTRVDLLRNARIMCESKFLGMVKRLVCQCVVGSVERGLFERLLTGNTIALYEEINHNEVASELLFNGLFHITDVLASARRACTRSVFADGSVCSVLFVHDVVKARAQSSRRVEERAAAKLVRQMAKDELELAAHGEEDDDEEEGGVGVQQQQAAGAGAAAPPPPPPPAGAAKVDPSRFIPTLKPGQLIFKNLGVLEKHRPTLFYDGLVGDAAVAAQFAAATLSAEGEIHPPTPNIFAANLHERPVLPEEDFYVIVSIDPGNNNFVTVYHSQTDETWSMSSDEFWDLAGLERHARQIREWKAWDKVKAHHASFRNVDTLLHCATQEERFARVRERLQLGKTWISFLIASPLADYHFTLRQATDQAYDKVARRIAACEGGHKVIVLLGAWKQQSGLRMGRRAPSLKPLVRVLGGLGVIVIEIDEAFSSRACALCAFAKEEMLLRAPQRVVVEMLRKKLHALQLEAWPW